MASIKFWRAPACQALQSAELAFGKPEIIDGLRIPTEAADEDAEMQMMRAAPAPSSPPCRRREKNTIIIGQDENPASLGLPEPRTPGEALILKPDGKGGYEREFQIRSRPGRRWPSAERSVGACFMLGCCFNRTSTLGGGAPCVIIQSAFC